MEASDRDPYIVTFKNTLSSEVCKDIIERFEADPDVYKGVTGGGYDPTLKRSDDLGISDKEHWKDIDKILFDVLHEHLEIYYQYLIENYNYPKNYFDRPYNDLGYQIQRTIPGGFYHWHDDSSSGPMPESYRVITFLWYLNDVEDGYTEFVRGEKIYPEEGKLLLFPATWNYPHRGTTPSSVKYICTGWLVEINRFNKDPSEDGPSEGLMDTIHGGDEGSPETPID